MDATKPIITTQTKALSRTHNLDNSTVLLTSSKYCRNENFPHSPAPYLPKSKGQHQLQHYSIFNLVEAWPWQTHPNLDMFSWVLESDYNASNVVRAPSCISLMYKFSWCCFCIHNVLHYSHGLLIAEERTFLRGLDSIRFIFMGNIM